MLAARGVYNLVMNILWKKEETHTRIRIPVSAIV